MIKRSQIVNALSAILDAIEENEKKLEEKDAMGRRRGNCIHRR